MSTPDRRTQLIDAAITLIAQRGLRALTHRALDAALDLPAGSTSYYFRTKAALIDAVVTRITLRSRADFQAAVASGPAPTDLADAAHGIAVWLDQLLTERRDQLIARHALIIDLLDDDEITAKLTASLFSVERARELFSAMEVSDPATAAADFLALLEGAVFDRFAGRRRELTAGSADSVRQLERLLRTYFAGTPT
ncbi:TetR/AcrR family transcriptional regulator [Nocardia callitridis]|uniref:TetR/AcrR family transcriptional regulator n=1 Tax=Nocardia callitridis TaxID=648753 RepID=A0ABP9K3T6_9NOCA